ncbi:hypothetical protein ACIRU8_10505 [Streptomyces sp. NPDC101175]|uniref:hypothetical protein n=1 Tax=Streptomyces sp. NPDC101175 TaxID=3366123 RepID=UPI0038368ED2
MTDRPPPPAATADDVTLSAECTVGRQPGYGTVHAMCNQTKDIPLPFGGGLLLQKRCGCICHDSREADNR